MRGCTCQMRSEVKECLYLLGVSIASAFLAGGFCTGVQQLQAVPLIIEAEAFEVAETPATPTTPPVGGTRATTPKPTTTVAVAAADDEEWKPSGGGRHMCTFVSNVIIMWGYGLMFLGIFLIRNRPVGNHLKAVYDVRATLLGGFLWGTSGFIVFGLAPGLNLPPELPGMETADMENRQICWVFTSQMTALGLLCLYQGKPTYSWHAWVYVAGIFFLVVPQLVGAPKYDHIHGSPERPPPELSAKFAIVALVVQGLSWVSLGMVTAFGWNCYFARYGIEEEAKPMTDASGWEITPPSIIGSSGAASQEYDYDSGAAGAAIADSFEQPARGAANDGYEPYDASAFQPPPPAGDLRSAGAPPDPGLQSV